jgi:hypothetical protein
MILNAAHRTIFKSFSLGAIEKEVVKIRTQNRFHANPTSCRTKSEWKENELQEAITVCERDIASKSKTAKTKTL